MATGIALPIPPFVATIVNSRDNGDRKADDGRCIAREVSCNTERLSKTCPGRRYHYRQRDDKFIFVESRRRARLAFGVERGQTSGATDQTPSIKPRNKETIGGRPRKRRAPCRGENQGRYELEIIQRLMAQSAGTTINLTALASDENEWYVQQGSFCSF